MPQRCEHCDCGSSYLCLAAYAPDPTAAQAALDQITGTPEPALRLVAVAEFPDRHCSGRYDCSCEACQATTVAHIQRAKHRRPDQHDGMPIKIVRRAAA